MKLAILTDQVNVRAMKATHQMEPVAAHSVIPEPTRDTLGTGECTSCGSQETTADSGSTSSTDCVCVAGYYLSGGSCTQCGVGSIQVRHTSSTDCDAGCTTASSGYYTVDSSNNALSSPYKGAVGVKQADKGYYVVDSSGTATNSGGVRQDECPVGRYADADGTTECTSCGSQETTADDSCREHVLD